MDKKSIFDKKSLQERINNKNNNNSNKSNNKDNKGNSKFNLTWVYIGLLALLFVMIFSNNGEKTSKLPYNKFQECMDSGYVDNIFVNKADQELTFEIKKDYRLRIGESLPLDSKGRLVLMTNFPSLDKLDEFVQTTKDKGRFSGDVKYENGGSGFWDVFWQIFPFIFLIAFWIFIIRRMGGGGGGGIFSFGKSKAKLFDGGKSGPDKITFKDVAGMYGAKQEVQEVVDFLKNPQRYTELGGKIPKGILLVGPPGTGKTLLAKAVAGEANVSFFSLSGSDFVEMFVGVGASRVRDLFQQAKQKSPCIVFIDEIDAIGRARSGKASIQSNDERESTLNQLLTEMDGFGANTGVIVMAATNRADILDKALLRAGRFDRQISVELPDLKERQQIFNVHLKPIKIDETVDVEQLARQTPGLSGADIANVCNEAALIAARRKQEWVDKQCFLDAIDRVLGGLEKKTKVMTENEKRTIAIHEAGHATISWFLQHANPLVKVTIVPRGQALGANWYMPEERPVTTKEELLDQICGLLGGRAAEEIFTGYICTGASNDLERVTKMVYGMISIYGMGQRMPNINYYNFSENAFSRPYSEATAQMIDEEVKELIQTQYERAKNVLLQHSQGLKELAQLLIDKEVIYPADLEKIFGPRQWRSRSDEIMELNQNLAEDANANNEEGPIDFADENAEIIRQKALAAVMEKQKRIQEQKQKEERDRLEEQRKQEEKERREQLRKEEMRRQEETRKIAEQRRQEDMKRREEERLKREKEEEENYLSLKPEQEEMDERDAMELEYLNSLQVDKEEEDVQQVETNEENEDEQDNNETKTASTSVELSLFPDIDDDNNDKQENENEEKQIEDFVKMEDDYDQPKPQPQDDYNPFLDSWASSSDDEKKTQDDEPKIIEKKENYEAPAILNDEESEEHEEPVVENKPEEQEVIDEENNQVNIEDFIKRDDEITSEITEDEDEGLEFELNDEPDEKYVELRKDNQDNPDEDEMTQAISEMLEDKDDTNIDVVEVVEEETEDVTDEVAEDVTDETTEPEDDSDDDTAAQPENDEVIEEEPQSDEEEEEGEEIIITSKRKRRNFNIEEVLPENEDE